MAQIEQKNAEVGGFFDFGRIYCLETRLFPETCIMNEHLILPPAEDVEKVLRFDVKEVPSFPPVMTKLLELCNSDHTEMEDLARLIETDPGISTRVLSIVNSAFFGLARTITDVTEAIIFLGINEVKNVSLKASVFEKMIRPGKLKGFNRAFFWRHCLCVASLGRAIAEEIKYPNLEEAYMAGLLHDFGKIIFDLQGCVNYGEFVANAVDCTGPIIDEERDLMGMGHDDIGAYYSHAWHLPDTLSLVINHHHRKFGHLGLAPEEALLISIVSLANFLAWTQGIGSLDINHPPFLQPEVEQNICLPDVNFKRVIQKMDREMERTARFYNFVFPSSSQFRENLLQANLKLSAISSRTYFNPDEPQEKNFRSRTVMASITAPHRSLDPETIIQETLKAIYNDFKFDRIYFLRPAMPSRQLKVVRCLEKGNIATELASVQVSMHKKAEGLIRCLRQKEPILINGNLPGDKKILTAFQTPEMLIVPFCSRNKVIGILGMDYSQSKKSISSNTFSIIAVVANELGLALENASVYSEARSISRMDGLTGLLNRMAIDDLLRDAFDKAAKGEHELSLAMIDVDFFKKFNDTFGHQAGDVVLKLIARTLKKVSRPSDHVGRYGGEEFIVVLNNTSLVEAVAYAERIRKEVRRLGGMLANRFPGLTLSISAGVSQYKKGIKNKDSLVAAADKALYRAKETGRDRVVAG